MNERYEREIDMRWLLRRVIGAWKPIVIWAIIVGLVLGAGSAGIKALKLTDESYIAEAKAEAEREHDAWLATKEELQLELDNLEQKKARQEAYNENSVLMEIDPLREQVASFELYVDYDYQIKPDLTYQPVDLSNRIVKAYATYITGGEMYQYIIDNLDDELEMRFLKEILSAAFDYDNKMIAVTVVHDNGAKCQEILSLAREGILSRHDAVSQAIDVHEITTTSQVTYETVDFDLEEKQNENLQTLVGIEEDIREVEQKLQDWEKQEEPAFEYDVKGIVRGGIKMTAIAGVVAAVVFVAIVAFAAILSNKLLNPEDVKQCFGLRIIGQLPAEGHKKAKPEAYKALANVAGTSIKSDISARSALACKTIAFTGMAPAEEMEKAIAAMEIKEYSVVCAPNVLTDAASVEKVCAADCVVLIEKQEHSRVPDIEKELEVLKAWNKPVLGVVVVNTDAVK